MHELDPKFDDNFRRYAELEYLRHQLMQQGGDDSQEFADAEAQLGAIWPTLADQQQQSLRGMASDLNWVRRNGEFAPKGRKRLEDVPAAEGAALVQALVNSDWHAILHYSRLCYPILSLASLTNIRAMCYEAVGLPQYAATVREIARHGKAFGGITRQVKIASSFVVSESAKGNGAVALELNEVKAAARVDPKNPPENVVYRVCA